ncbi:isoprenyl transferase [Haoranjiania flava]|uniref:Isoprenyl transferase n=1 Tax=Haoranjiania flava TaxID=1856322 RepID=A0AAE3LJ84_9BACT|nr:isoprenyl transferase [Haoranjiania flava]MCU7693447.1 isoprenyl transferase [Haoranjiania flava]
MPEELLNNIDRNRVPSHIAIIMDGNGRWAKEKGEDRLFGHFNGVEAVRLITEAAAEAGVKYLTLYTFSKENWNRPQEEVAGLMGLLVDTIKRQVEDLNKNNIRFSVIGDMDTLPDNARTELIEAIESLSSNTGMNLILALNYSSRWEIQAAIQAIARQVKNNALEVEDISEDTLGKYLTTKDIPDPELMIRTGGERRISNFLLYQLAYAELYFTETLWPDFQKKHLYEAIADFQNRERRFGKTSEQVKNN